MVQLSYRTFDADSHYYETPDCFLRHMPNDKKHRAFQLAEVDGKVKTVIDGRVVSVFHPEGFFQEVAALPGSMREMMHAIKAGKKLDPDAGGHGGASISTGPIVPGALSLDKRFEQMDEHDVEGTLMFPSTAVYVEPTFLGDAELAWDNFRALNRWIDEEWGFETKGRIFAAPMISMCDLDEACAELDWALKKGARAIVLTTGPAAGRSPADPYFDPFWSRVNESGVLVNYHVGDHCYNANLSKFWGEKPDPMAYEQSAFQWTHFFGDRPIMETISALIYGNLFARFPNIRVNTVEYGSLWVPYLLKAMDKMIGMANAGPWPGGKLKDKPSRIFKEHVYVTPFHEDNMELLAELIGPDHILFGTDWPHPEGVAHPMDFAESLQGMDEPDIKRIMRTNLQTLLNAA